jgi:hypothetical protein
MFQFEVRLSVSHLLKKLGSKSDYIILRCMYYNSACVAILRKLMSYAMLQLGVIVSWLCVGHGYVLLGSWQNHHELHFQIKHMP